MERQKSVEAGRKSFLAYQNKKAEKQKFPQQQGEGESKVFLSESNSAGNLTLDGQSREENNVIGGVLEGIFDSVDKIPKELISQGDEIGIRVHEELSMVGEREVISSTSDMELHIQQCHERIMEFDQELKQRDGVVLLLGETLTGILKMLKAVQLQGESANEDVAVLMTRVHNASELLHHMGLEEMGGDNIASQNQEQSLADEKESSAVVHGSMKSNTNNESRPSETAMGQCGQHCVHSDEIAQITKKVHMGFERLQIPVDFIDQSSDTNIASKVECLTLQAMKYKQDSEESLTQLELFKKESQSIQSCLLNKEVEVKKMMACIEELQFELNELRNRSCKLEHDEISSNRLLETLTDGRRKTDKQANKTEDKCLQSVIDMKIMNSWLETLPNESQFTENSLPDNLLEFKLLKTEHNRTRNTLAMEGNDKGSNVNKTEEGDIGIKQTKIHIPEKLKSNIFFNMHESSSGSVTLESSVNIIEKVENVVNPKEFDSEGPGILSDTAGVLEKKMKVQEIFVCDEAGEEALDKCLVGNEDIEEFLFNLGSKARELLLAKKQLKIMEDKERKLRSQLNSALDSCEKAEKRCRNAENLAMNLQNDLEVMYCKLRAFEMNKPGIETGISGNPGKIVSAAIVPPSSQVSVENWQICPSPDLVEGSTEIGEEYISSFLANFWKKIGLIVDVVVNIPEEKTDIFVPKKMASLKASLESDINELALYLKRKYDMLKHLKLSLDAQSRFHDLQVQVEKELWSHGDFGSVLAKEIEPNDEDGNNLTNGITRDDRFTSGDFVDSLNSLHMEMDCINSKVIKCLKYCMEQDFEKQSTELKMNYATDIASMKQMHIMQLNSIKQEMSEKITMFQEKTEEVLIEKLKVGTKMEYVGMDILKESHKTELEEVWKKLDEKQKEVYECLKERFGRITAEQISLATQMYKASYDFKTNQEIYLLKSIHEEEMEVMKSSLEHQKLKELHSLRQEMSKSHKENVNEIIQAVEAEMKELRCRCQDLALKTSLANTAALNGLRKNIISECQLALKELSGIWLKQFENEVETLEQVLGTTNKEKEHMKSTLPDGGTCDESIGHSQAQTSMVELRELFLSKSEAHFKEVAQWQLSGMHELMERLQVEQDRFKVKLSEMQTNVSMLKKDEDKLLENKSEYCSVNQNICSLMGAGDGPWINEMHNLRKELEAKHAKEMESLRLYFEKKYAEVEKRYSEEVLTQRSKKCSQTGSSDSSSSTSISGSDAELESDQFFLSHEEADASSRNIEEYERVSLDMQLVVGQDIASVAKDFSQDNGLQLPSSVELEAKIREEMRLQFEEEHQRRLAKTIKELEAKHEEDLKIQVAAEAKAYSDHIEEVTNAIKKCSEEEQDKFIKSHREMMDNFLMQHQKDLIALNELHDQELNALRNSDATGELEELKAEIDKMKSRHNQELLIAKLTMKAEIDEASQRLIQEHTNELYELKQSLKCNHEEVEQLKNEIKRKALLAGDGTEGNKESCLEGNSSELAMLKERLGIGTKQVSVMKEHHRKEIEAVKEVHREEVKKLMADRTEWSNPVLLEQQVDLLKQGIESDFNDRFSRSECMGRDLLTLKLQVNQLEQSKNVLLSKFGESDVELDDATSVTILHTDLDKLLKDRDKWKKVTQTLKKLLKDVLEYTQNCEEELNGTIVQSILRLSGMNEKYSLLEDVGEDDRPRRVHFALEGLPIILEHDELDVEGGGENVISQLEESSEEMRVELRQCLGRLRAEASALLGLSSSFGQSEGSITLNDNLHHSQQELIDKISLLENHLKLETMEKDRLKVELHTANGLCEGHAAAEVTLLDRATQAEAQLAALLMRKAEAQRGVETVAEGFGEGSELPTFNGQLQKLAQLREKARWVLKEHRGEGGNSSAKGDNQAGSSGPLIAHLIEELCSEGDRLTEEARRDREDLQQQVEAADKQLRSTRAFLEEQAVEREQEREEFQRELNRLHEALGGREREKGEKERMVKEEMPLPSKREGQDTFPPSRLTVEVLEQQSKELAQMLKDTTDRKDELETELKAAVDKIWDLREIIRELEGQVEGSLLLERDLRGENEKLATEMALQSKKLNDLIEELESLQSSLGYSIPGEMENEGHTALLEQALRKHCLQVEQAKAMGPSLKDLTKELLEMGASIDRKTKELEVVQVTPMTCGNCSSPSEDVSIREQLEQATWRSESPMEDEVTDRGVVGDEEDIIRGVSKGTSLTLPRVPLPELHCLQDKFNRHFQAQEPLLKRIHDLEMQVQTLRRNEEELMTERDVLQSQVEVQLLQTSELQARLDEARRRGGRHIHCMTVTPLPTSPISRSPIGSPSATPDHPSFCCAGLADARHEIENLTNCLEKKELEVTQLKSALENSKKVVASQEKELTNKSREEAQTMEKLKELERLKSEIDMLQMKLSHKIKSDGGVVPFSVLLDTLLAEKNEEIDFLGSQLTNLKEQLSKVVSFEEEKCLPQKLDYVPEESIEKQPVSEHSKENKSGESHYDDVEVLRDCVMPESLLDKSDVIHPIEHQEYRKAWFHSTKIEAHNSTNDSPGLAVSPLTPYENKVHIVINEPVLEEESLEKTPSCTLSGASDSSKDEGGVASKKGLDGAMEGENYSKEVKDAEVQTMKQTEIEDLKTAHSTKDDEIKALIIKVDVLLVEKENLSLIVTELREKIDWHSRHLEKFEEESLGRDALINEVRTEKKVLETTLQKSEQEMVTLKSLHAELQDAFHRKEEQIKLLNGKVDKYSKANKEQHMLLKAVQQERKEIVLLLKDQSIGSKKNSEYEHAVPSSTAIENRTLNQGKDEETSQRRLPSPAGPKTSLREMVIKLIDEVQSLKTELKCLTSQRDQLKQDLEKASECQVLVSVKESPKGISGEFGSGESEEQNQSNEKLGPLSFQGERGSSPSLVSLEQMMEKVQQEGIEVLSLSELAAGRRSTPGGTPTFIASPLGSPKSVEEKSNLQEKSSSIESLKNKPDVCIEDERAQLLLRIQALENELSSKEREEMRKRDWLEFQEKEGHAGWAGVVEAVGQKQRHELNILERLGEQRNARARLEAEVVQLHQQLAQAEAEGRKVTYRLGMERSHVIRLESALQQEKSNFSQLQVSLDTERRRANMTKQLNSKVCKALQSELVQYQAKLSHLQASLKQEHDLRRELEARLKRIQMEQGYAPETTEEQRLRLEAIAKEEHRQLKKIEDDCERKALEQELEDEKQKRMEYQQEVIQLRNLLEARPNHEPYGPAESTRWSATSPSTPYVSESSFNAEDMLQNLKGINQVLGWHVRQREEYQNPDLASIETEKHYLEAKCCHLEQKLVTMQDLLARERAQWANERSLLLKDQQYLLEMNGPQHSMSKEVHKFQDLVQQLYSLYWRSERNRKALAWQKRYFLSVLGDYRNFKVDTITELSKVTDEQRIVVDRITGLGRIKYSKGNVASNQLSQQKPRVRKSFRVLVWTVIATLKMRVLVLRSMTGIRVGCQSLLEDILQPTCSHVKTHSSYHHQSHQHIPCATGTTEMPSHCGVPSLSPTSKYRKSYSVGDMK